MKPPAPSGELISAVIPTYNRAPILIEALESVIRQTYRPIEIVVVDDGSEDGTPELVRTWMRGVADPAIAFKLIAQPHLGGNAARNRGILESSGSLVAFLDSDDLWLEEKLARQAGFFADPAVGGVYCGVEQIDRATGEAIGSQARRYPAGRILSELLIKDVTAPTSTYVVRRESFDRVGYFDTELAARQDWDMWIRLAARYRIEAVPIALVQFRHHAGPRTAANPYREIEGYRRIRSKYAALLSRQPLRVRAAARASYHKRLGRVFFHHEISRANALSNYLLAVVFNPFDFDTWAAFAGFFLPAGLRRQLHESWNRRFGGTGLAIRSH